jgi:hypothetical protein
MESDDEDNKQMIMVASMDMCAQFKEQRKMSVSEANEETDESASSNNIFCMSFHSNYIPFLGDIA